MWRSLFETSNATIWIAVALQSACLTQSAFHRQSELLSEALSWLVLLFLFNISKQTALDTNSPFRGHRNHSTSSLSIWLIALCLTSTSLYKAEFGTINFLVSGIPAKEKS